MAPCGGLSVSLKRCPSQVAGHGNFGSLDNDPAAAMRYTECRLPAVATAVLLADLEFDTVDFAPNFDGSQVDSGPISAAKPASPCSDHPHASVNIHAGALCLATVVYGHSGAAGRPGVRHRRLCAQF